MNEPGFDLVGALHRSLPGMKPDVRAAATAIAVLVALAAGATVTWIQPDLRYLLLASIALAVMASLALRALGRGGLDIFEPLVPASAALLIFFVVRPLFDLPKPGLVYTTVDISATYVVAEAAALTAAVGFGFGYGIGLGRLLATSLPKPPRPQHDSALMYGGLGLSAVALVAVLASTLLMSGGISLSTLLAGRDPLGGGVNVPFITEAAVLAIPAFLILWSVSGPARPFARVASALPMAVILVDALPRGDRRTLLPFFIAVAVFWYLKTGRRPSTRTVLLAGMVGLLAFSGPLRMSRTGSMSFFDAVIATVSDPAGAFSDTFHSGDTEMVDTLALEVAQVGQVGGIPWQNGMSALTETLLQPIPRQLWPEKPQTTRTQLIQLNWGMANGQCVSLCPTFSAIGSLYADFGLPSVLVGAVLLGLLFRAWYEYFSKWRDNAFAQAAYAGTLVLPFFVWWSGLSTVALYLIYYVVPLLFAMWLGSGGDSAQVGAGGSPSGGARWAMPVDTTTGKSDLPRGRQVGG